MANYIQTLRLENEELRTKMAEIETQLLALKRYLLSDKFAGIENNFVNPTDVIRWIDGEILPHTL